jgi:SAM-dependent methyltransferase
MIRIKMNEYWKSMTMGLASFVPGMRRLYGALAIDDCDVKKRARYNYSVWLRHLIMAQKNGLQTIPRVVVELGPGESLGTGLAALLCGAERYFAFDIAAHATSTLNVEVLDELVRLFNRREDVPGDEELPSVAPQLQSYRFPDNILPEESLLEFAASKRVARIRNDLLRMNDVGRLRATIRYFAPWNDDGLVGPESVDMVVSQDVMEHVVDLDKTYRALHRWLKVGGILSERIDFNSHGTAKQWNGHWAYSDFTWKLMRGKRPYLINREPSSTHINYLERYDFKIECELREIDELGGIQRIELSKRYKHLSKEDLETKSIFIQATKRGKLGS